MFIGYLSDLLKQVRSVSSTKHSHVRTRGTVDVNLAPVRSALWHSVIQLVNECNISMYQRINARIEKLGAWGSVVVKALRY
jgi:hypothetical protein